MNESTGCPELDDQTLVKSSIAIPAAQPLMGSAFFVPDSEEHVRYLLESYCFRSRMRIIDGPDGIFHDRDPIRKGEPYWFVRDGQIGTVHNGRDGTPKGFEPCASVDFDRDKRTLSLSQRGLRLNFADHEIHIALEEVSRDIPKQGMHAVRDVITVEYMNEEIEIRTEPRTEWYDKDLEKAEKEKRALEEKQREAVLLEKKQRDPLDAVYAFLSEIDLRTLVVNALINGGEKDIKDICYRLMYRALIREFPQYEHEDILNNTKGTGPWKGAAHGVFSYEWRKRKREVAQLVREFQKNPKNESP